MAMNMEDRLWQRRGLVGWWLTLTAPPRPARGAPIAEMERIRKAELTSMSILAVFLLVIALVSTSLANVATGQAVAFTAIGLTVAGLLNRRGWTHTAGYLVPLVIMLALVLLLVQLGTVGIVSISLYALFALPVLLSGFIADRRAPWILAALALGMTLLDYSYAPAVGDELRAFGWWGTMQWDMAVILFAALFSWLGALSVERALARADRADEIAVLQREKQHRAEEVATGLADFMHELLDAFATQDKGQPAQLKERGKQDPLLPYVYFFNRHLRNE